MSGTTTRSTGRLKARLAVAIAIGCITALGLIPVALAKVRHSASKTVTLGARQTKTVDVGYPQALKFKNAKYSCTFKVTGVDPKKVKILFHGSAKGGSVCRVKARNPAAPSPDASVKLKVTATTVH